MSRTKTGAVLGTPYYMSPEQARGLRTIDHRTDLWSLGVIAYKCVVGVLPFEGESVGDVLVKICTSPLPVPSLAAPDVPPCFDTWFARALDRDPERRFGNASELAEALAQCAGVHLRRPGVSGETETPLPSLPRATSGASPGPVAPAATVVADFTAPPVGPGSGGDALGPSPATANSGHTFSASPNVPENAKRRRRVRTLWVVGAALAGGALGVTVVAQLASTPRAATTPAANAGSSQARAESPRAAEPPSPSPDVRRAGEGAPPVSPQSHTPPASATLTSPSARGRSATSAWTASGGSSAPAATPVGAPAGSWSTPTYASSHGHAATVPSVRTSASQLPSLPAASAHPPAPNAPAGLVDPGY